MSEKWLEWSKRLQAIAQAGLAYSNELFDKERYERIRDISVEIMNEYTEIGEQKVRDLFANETGYQTPKVDVRAAIFRDNTILLVKESDQKWSLPGGWADVGLSVSENAVKESLEEAGARVKPIRILGIIDRNRHYNDLYPYSVYVVYVECEYLGGEFQENMETLGANFFELDNLPELSKQRTSKSQIEMCFHAKCNRSETIFD